MAYAQSNVFAVLPDQDSQGPKDETASPAEGQQQFAWLLSRAKARDKDPFEFQLVLRFVLVNLVGLALVGCAYKLGYIESMLSADRTYLSVLICGVFLAGLSLCGWRICQTSRDLNQARDFDPLVPSRAAVYLSQVRGRDGSSRAILANNLKLKLAQRISVVRHFANALVVLGLIGTVIGFIIALSGVNPETASDVKAVAPMVSTLIQGMSTALYTTLVGAVCNVWLMINFRLLSGGTVKLFTRLVEFGESHGRV